MKLFIFAAAFISTAIAFRYADGAEPKRAARPVVCANYRIVDADLAVCSDSRKPFILRSFSEVESVSPEGDKVRVLVGWR